LTRVYDIILTSLYYIVLNSPCKSNAQYNQQHCVTATSCQTSQNQLVYYIFYGCFYLHATNDVNNHVTAGVHKMQDRKLIMQTTKFFML